MENKILDADFYSELPMESFINQKLKKLNNITLMETVNNVIFRRVFIKFIQKIHSTEAELDTMIMIKRYIICQKLLLNHESFEDDETYNKLIELCPSLLWQQKIRNLANRGETDINFTYTMEKLKWETIIELICHDDYKSYLTAIKLKSKIITEILIDIYNMYYF